MDSYYDEADDGMEDRECPDCDGQCYDDQGRPCRTCHGEGFILTGNVIRGRMVS